MARRIDLARLLVEMVAESFQRRHAAAGPSGGGEAAAGCSLVAQPISLGPAFDVRVFGGRNLGVQTTWIEFWAVQRAVLRSGKREHKLVSQPRGCLHSTVPRDMPLYHLRVAQANLLRQLLGLPLGLRRAHRFGALGTIGERLPGGFGPAATLSHMLERRRFPLDPRLFGPGEEELEV